MLFVRNEDIWQSTTQPHYKPFLEKSKHNESNICQQTLLNYFLCRQTRLRKF